jgi:hypothetical protein
MEGPPSTPDSSGLHRQAEDAVEDVDCGADAFVVVVVHRPLQPGDRLRCGLREFLGGLAFRLAFRCRSPAPRGTREAVGDSFSSYASANLPSDSVGSEKSSAVDQGMRSVTSRPTPALTSAVKA